MNPHKFRRRLRWYFCRGHLSRRRYQNWLRHKSNAEFYTIYDVEMYTLWVGHVHVSGPLLRVNA